MSATPNPAAFTERMRALEEEAHARAEIDRQVAERLRAATRACRRSTDTGKTLMPKIPNVPRVSEHSEDTA